MLSRADEIVAAYRREGWRSEPYGAFLALEADELPELVFRVFAQKDHLCQCFIRGGGVGRVP